jgi:hypothetical protein
MIWQVLPRPYRRGEVSKRFEARREKGWKETEGRKPTISSARMHPVRCHHWLLRSTRLVSRQRCRVKGEGERTSGGN